MSLDHCSKDDVFEEPAVSSVPVSIQENIVELIDCGDIGRLNATQKIQSDSFEMIGYLNFTIRKDNRMIFIVNNVNNVLAGVKRGFVSIYNGARGGSSIFEFVTKFDIETKILTIYIKDSVNEVLVLKPGVYKMQISFYATVNSFNKYDEFYFPCPPCHCHPVSR